MKIERVDQMVEFLIEKLEQSKKILGFSDLQLWELLILAAI